jgi:hypothetical protein
MANFGLDILYGGDPLSEDEFFDQMLEQLGGGPPPPLVIEANASPFIEEPSSPRSDDSDTTASDDREEKEEPVGRADNLFESNVLGGLCNDLDEGAEGADADGDTFGEADADGDTFGEADDETDEGAEDFLGDVLNGGADTYAGGDSIQEEASDVNFQSDVMFGGASQDDCADNVQRSLAAFVESIQL